MGKKGRNADLELRKQVKQEVLKPLRNKASRERRDGGAVERGGLENRWPFTGLVGSNPTLS